MQRQSFTHDKPTCVRAQFDKYNGLFSVALKSEVVYEGVEAGN